MSDWFDSLGDCLHWNERKIQKPMNVASPSNSANNSLVDHNSNDASTSAATNGDTTSAQVTSSVS